MNWNKYFLKYLVAVGKVTFLFDDDHRENLIDWEEFSSFSVPVVHSVSDFMKNFKWIVWNKIDDKIVNNWIKKVVGVFLLKPIIYNFFAIIKLQKCVS